MFAVAATCDFTKTPAARSCSRTASVPIGPISAGGGRRPRTHSGQRRRVSHHGQAFPQLRGSFGRQSVNTVKPSAQPTLVRTQHLPPPAKTARWLRKRGPAGRFLLVTSCIAVRHCGSMHGSVHVHMVYSVRAKLAVRITARFADPRPFCPVFRVPGCRASGLAGSSPCCSR
jgi:hypothetical protein